MVYLSLYSSLQLQTLSYTVLQEGVTVYLEGAEVCEVIKVGV